MAHIRLFGSLILLALVTGPLRAQQDPMYSQYMFNTLAFNPAYAGSADVFTAMLLGRQQWVGFKGAPSTQTLAIHSPLPGRKLAIGGELMHDVAGPAKQTSAFIDVAYRIRTGGDSRLSFGLKGGVNMFQADLANPTSGSACSGMHHNGMWASAHRSCWRTRSAKPAARCW
jgi:type IX secretion system PorP/SprF family membrane protein